MPTTRGTSAWSAVSGPAKWAAVLVLGVTAGAGVMYGTLRPSPTPIQAAPTVVLHPASNGAVAVELPAKRNEASLPSPSATLLSVESTPPAPASNPTSAPATTTSSPQPAAVTPDVTTPSSTPPSAPAPDATPSREPVAPSPEPSTPVSPKTEPAKSATPATKPSAPQTSTPAKPAPSATPSSKSAAPAATKPSAKAAALTRTININTATKAELELLPRVGPALAQRILDYRAQHGPFRTVDELDHVKGIGTKTLTQLRPLVTVGKPGETKPAEPKPTEPKQR